MRPLFVFGEYAFIIFYPFCLSIALNEALTADRSVPDGRHPTLLNELIQETPKICALPIAVLPLFARQQ